MNVTIGSRQHLPLHAVRNGEVLVNMVNTLQLPARMSNSKFVHYPWLTLGREVLILKRSLLGDETASALLFIGMGIARSGGADMYIWQQSFCCTQLQLVKCFLDFIAPSYRKVRSSSGSSSNETTWALRRIAQCKLVQALSSLSQYSVILANLLQLPNLSLLSSLTYKAYPIYTSLLAVSVGISDEDDQ